MPINTNEVLKKHNIRLTKTLGQNFLTDINILRKIVDTAMVDKEDLVLEIGPGIGALTYHLALKAGRVVAVEIDKNLISALNENLHEFDNIEIVNQDIMKTDLQSLLSDWNGPIKVVANLPYYITTPIIMSLLESDFIFSNMVFMVQKEVAARINAIPGTKDYGALSVGIQYYSKPEFCFTVSPHCFLPKPDVDSAVIRLNIYDNPPVKLLNKKLFFQVVRASFAQRRKTLLNSLGNAGIPGLNKEVLKEILGKMSIDESIRGERLDIQSFAELSNYIDGVVSGG